MTDNPTAKLDQLSLRYANAIVLFLRRPSNRPTGAEGFGSGFLLTVKDEVYLITAYHVAAEFSGNVILMRTEAASIILENIVFSYDFEADLAVAHIGPTLEAHDVRPIVTVPVERPNGDYRTANIVLFLGYPSSANQVDVHSRTPKFTLLSISGEKVHSPKALTSIKMPIYCDFKRKDMRPGLNRSPQSRVAPEPFGMSGGAVLEVLFSPTSRTFQASIIGVAASWDRKNNYLIASNICDIWPLISGLPPTSQ